MLNTGHTWDEVDEKRKPRDNPDLSVSPVTPTCGLSTRVFMLSFLKCPVVVSQFGPSVLREKYIVKQHRGTYKGKCQ